MPPAIPQPAPDSLTLSCFPFAHFAADASTAFLHGLSLIYRRHSTLEAPGHGEETHHTPISDINRESVKSVRTAAIPPSFEGRADQSNDSNELTACAKCPHDARP